MASHDPRRGRTGLARYAAALTLTALLVGGCAVPPPGSGTGPAPLAPQVPKDLPESTTSASPPPAAVGQILFDDDTAKAACRDVGSSPTGWSTVKLAPGGLAVITCPVTAGGDTSSQLIGFDLSRRTPTWRVSLP